MATGRIVAAITVSCALSGCANRDRAHVGAPLERRGDEIMVCGQLFHTGAPVVLWTDPEGYDAYRTEKRFVPWDKAAYVPAAGVDTPNRYGLRFSAAGRGPASTGEVLNPAVLEQVRGGGWDLPTLQQHVDQFVIHYDVCGTSRQCFRVLHDMRGLSVHFMLDIDGTIYQTLDVKERAWHATTSNDRSVGIEIANMGAYPMQSTGELPETLQRWYKAEEVDGELVTRLTLPLAVGDGGVRGPFTGPVRPEPVVGTIQGRELVMYDLTEAQYDSLIRLTATLHRVLPAIRLDYPRDTSGKLLTEKLPDADLAKFQGILGHFHIQENKTDPGPAFQWEAVVDGAQRLVD